MVIDAIKKLNPTRMKGFLENIISNDIIIIKNETANFSFETTKDELIKIFSNNKLMTNTKGNYSFKAINSDVKIIFSVGDYKYWIKDKKYEKLFFVNKEKSKNIAEILVENIPNSVYHISCITMNKNEYHTYDGSKDGAKQFVEDISKQIKQRNGNEIKILFNFSNTSESKEKEWHTLEEYEKMGVKL